jgi:hypothetical protein
VFGIPKIVLSLEELEDHAGNLAALMNLFKNDDSIQDMI